MNILVFYKTTTLEITCTSGENGYIVKKTTYKNSLREENISHFGYPGNTKAHTATTQ